jgi:hypothetical protein
MKSLVVIGLLALLQEPSATQKPAGGQPCAGPELVGTWQLVDATGSTSSAGAPTILKHVTPTHFFVLSADATGLASYGHGGPYTLSNGVYTETIANGFGRPFTNILRGTKVRLQCRMDAGVWHTAGEINGQAFDERWRRVTAVPER